MAFKRKWATNFANAVMNRVRQMKVEKVVSNHREPVRNDDIGAFRLPHDVLLLRGQLAPEETAERYVHRVIEDGVWGILFRDRSVACISYQLDVEASESDKLVPRSFSYLFAAPASQRTGKQMDSASFFRIEMHPDKTGDLINEPVVHLHGNRNGAPRFSLSMPPTPQDFLDFIYRTRFPREWADQNQPCMEHLYRLQSFEQIASDKIVVTDLTTYYTEVEIIKKSYFQNPRWFAHKVVARYPFIL